MQIVARSFRESPQKADTVVPQVFQHRPSLFHSPPQLCDLSQSHRMPRTDISESIHRICSPAVCSGIPALQYYAELLCDCIYSMDDMSQYRIQVFSGAKILQFPQEKLVQTQTADIYIPQMNREQI
jgi:hypothetical protein